MTVGQRIVPVPRGARISVRKTIAKHSIRPYFARVTRGRPVRVRVLALEYDWFEALTSLRARCQASSGAGC